MTLYQTLSQYFLEPWLAWTLLLLIPFVLLYLIRPKPRHQVMPSLMFFFKDLGKNRKTQFLRRLITNLLFLLQFLLLLAILLASAKPYVNVSKESLYKNTVLVLDVSASMKASYEGGTRFDAAKKLAKDNLGSITTLVLAKKVPDPALIDESQGEVRTYLDKLTPTDNPSNLYGALSAAGGYAKSDSRIVAISDFLDTETDTDLGTIKKTLEAQGIKVDFIQVHSPVPNVGIVDLAITDQKTTAVIKNYNKDSVEVKAKIGSLTETLVISPESKELFTFSTPPTTSKLELDVKDGFEPDNTAYISAPSDVKKKILFITNNANPQKTYLYNVLDVMKTTSITIAIPPKIPDLEGYDVYVFKDINNQLILPGTFKGIKKEVEGGKAAIIAGSPTTVNTDFQGLYPTKIWEVTQSTAVLSSGVESLTENIEFGATNIYYQASPMPGLVTIASNDNQSPIITFNAMGAGKVLFYGIPDENKDANAVFAKSPAYFVFWKRTFDLITNTPTVKNLNFKTGSYLSLGEEQTVTTPTGTLKTANLPLDNTGLYTLKDRTVAINLISEKESDVSRLATINIESLSQGSERFKDKVPYEITDHLIIAAVVLLILELAYIKLRGDF